MWARNFHSSITQEVLKLRQLFSTDAHHVRFLLKILLKMTAGKFISLWHRFPLPHHRPFGERVSSFPLNYVNNPKAREDEQTALPAARCRELSRQADPRQLPGLQPGCRPVRPPSALSQAPADPFAKKCPGVCCLLARPHVGCQLPGSCCPLHLLALRCFPDAPNPLLSARWHPFTLFTFLYISFLSAWRCFFGFFSLAFLNVNCTHTRRVASSVPLCLLFSAHESAGITWCGAAGSI